MGLGSSNRKIYVEVVCSSGKQLEGTIRDYSSVCDSEEEITREKPMIKGACSFT